MIINIEVKNRVATYRSYGSDPVCGSNNDTVKFHFDSEWQDVGTKTARFVWGGRYYDQEFEGDSCPAPMFVNLTRVMIGVYAGEPVDGEPAWASTQAEVPYRLSVRCGYNPPNPESGSGYTNEARGYALEAQAAAEIAVAAAESGERVVEQAREVVEDAYGLEEIGRLTLRLNAIEGSTEDGMLYEAWTLGDREINNQNGGLPLICGSEEWGSVYTHPQANEIIRLMRCNVTRFVIDHDNWQGTLRNLRVYDGRGTGETWCAVTTPVESSGWALFATEWCEGGPRLACCDNPSAPSFHGGPHAIFLQFPKSFAGALNTAGLHAGNYNTPYLDLTIIGYN